MKFLLDTNVLIRAEPTSHADVEPGTAACVELIRLASEVGHQTYVHPASIAELNEDQDATRRNLRELLSRKYPALRNPPPPAPILEAAFGRPAPGSHDVTDLALLASVHADAVHYLVTDDQRLIRRARRAGLGDRVLAPEDAIAVLLAFFPRYPVPPPLVEATEAYSLDQSDPIFDSFRSDYPGFNSWMVKVKREHRRTWVVRRDGGALGAVCIVKDERTGEHGLKDRVLKLCSFKVSDAARGLRFADLILSGAKRVEFRKRPFRSNVTHVVIYSSGPVSRVVGAFEVQGIDVASPSELWKRYVDVAGAPPAYFADYYEDCETGVAIRIGQVFPLEQPIPLSDLCSEGHPPQSFRYLSANVLDRIGVARSC